MQTNDKVLSLIKYIVCYATDHDTKLTTTQLVKYIYLADLYYARYNNGDTITKFPWAFIHYGPYCSEVWNSIEEAASTGLISKMTYESRFEDKDYYLFSCEDIHYEELRRLFPIVVTTELHDKIRKYADDTAQLLDYVYFETEPMINATKGDRLNFSMAQKPRLDFTVKTPKLSKEDIKKIKYHVAQLGERLRLAKDKKIEDEKLTDKFRDDEYCKALEYFDDDSLPTGISGTIKIQS